MKFISLLIISTISLSASLFLGEALLAMEWGKDKFINPSHTPSHFGQKGKPLLYVVMGDSTAAGRGAHYGIAQETANYLGQTASVTMINLGISGAKLSDVIQKELAEAIKLKPDLVLLSIGANDATNFTSDKTIQTELTTIIQELSKSNAAMGIVVTGSADIGAVPRFLQPLRWLAGEETKRVNRVIEKVAKVSGVIWTPLAEETGPAFQKDPSLFAADKFHPNDRGYAVWFPYLNAALEKALHQNSLGQH